MVKVHINPTHSTPLLLDSGVVVALVPVLLKASMECPILPLLAGFLPAKASRPVVLEVLARGTALGTRLDLVLKDYPVRQVRQVRE